MNHFNTNRWRHHHKAAIPNMKPAKAGQPYSAAINHVIVGQVLHSPALNEGHVLVNLPYLELLTTKAQIT